MRSLRSLTTEEFDAFVDGLDYPLFVVTAASGSEADGCLVGFATQCSIDPPLLLVCLSRKNRTYRIGRGSDFLAVHVLASGEHALAERFGGETGDDVDKLAGLQWRPGPSGVPLVAALPRVLVGRVLERLDLGDHVGHVLEPVAVEADEDQPALMLHEAEDVEAGHEN